jgi:hypothetical protein
MTSAQQITEFEVAEKEKPQEKAGKEKLNDLKHREEKASLESNKVTV